MTEIRAQKRKNPESHIQRACITWFAMQHRGLWLTKRLHSVPNGGKRNAVTAAILKSEGQIPGVWDLHLTVKSGAYCGLFIEIKAGKNKLTTEQWLFRESHQNEYCFAVCYSLEDFMKAVQDYLGY